MKVIAAFMTAYILLLLKRACVLFLVLQHRPVGIVMHIGMNFFEAVAGHATEKLSELALPLVAVLDEGRFEY